MEVLLKKTKITKSIVEQSLYGNSNLYLGHPNYEPLGWCSVLKGKYRYNYILLYDKADSTILRLDYIKNIYLEEKQEQTRKEGLTYDDWYFPTYYYLKLSDTTIVRTLNKDARDEAKIKLQKFLREIEQKGQIYV